MKDKIDHLVLTLNLGASVKVSEQVEELRRSVQTRLSGQKTLLVSFLGPYLTRERQEGGTLSKQIPKFKVLDTEVKCALVIVLGRARVFFFVTSASGFLFSLTSAPSVASERNIVGICANVRFVLERAIYP